MSQPTPSCAVMLNPFAPGVVLSTTVTIDGLEITYERHLDRIVFGGIDQSHWGSGLESHVAPSEVRMDIGIGA